MILYSPSVDPCLCTKFDDLSFVIVLFRVAIITVVSNETVLSLFKAYLTLECLEW